MRWGAFQVAEYINMIDALRAHGDALLRRLGRPGAAGADLVHHQARARALVVHLAAGHPPRLRYDQLMRFGWKVLLPVATLNALVTAVLVVAVE